MNVKKTIAERTALKNKLANLKVFPADIALFQQNFPASRLNNDLRRANKYNEERLQKQVLYALLEKVGEEEIHSNRAQYSKEYAAELKAQKKAEKEAAKQAEEAKKAAEAEAAKKATEEAEKMAAEEAEKKVATETNPDEVNGEKPKNNIPEKEGETEGKTPETKEVETKTPTPKPDKAKATESKKKNAGASKKSSQK